MDKGIPFLNIGTEKACLFIHLSERLVNVLKKHRLLHFAIEEALNCASQGYYAAGILAYSQFFNCFGIKAPKARHKVAHEFLRYRPTTTAYNNILQTLKYIAEVAYIQEVDKFDGTREELHKKLFSTWEKYINGRLRL